MVTPLKRKSSIESCNSWQSRGCGGGNEFQRMVFGDEIVEEMGHNTQEELQY